MEWTRYGPDAAMIRFAGNPGAMGLARAIAAELESNPPEGLREFTIAYDRLLVEFEAPCDVARAGSALAGRLSALAPRGAEDAPLREIPVHYDGPDLERLAAEKGLSVDNVITLHSAVIYEVAMIGFAPGFPYLHGLDSRLATPRLATPRPVVKAGSVGIGGSHTGIYSLDSPGGWHIIGHTSLRLFDPAREDEAMFFLRTGDRVKFQPVT